MENGSMKDEIIHCKYGLNYYMARRSGLSHKKALEYREKCIKDFDKWMFALNHNMSPNDVTDEDLKTINQ